MRKLARRLRSRVSGTGRLQGLMPRVMFAPRAGDEHWATLQADVTKATTTLTESDWQSLRLHDRIAFWLVAGDHREDLTTALVDRSEHGGSFASSVEPLLARPGYLDQLSTTLPDWLLVPSDRDLRLAHDLVFRPGTDGLVVTGSAFVRGIEFVPGRDRIRMWALGAERTELDVEQLTDPRIDAVSNDRWCSYAGASLRARVGAADAIEVEVTAGPVVRRAEISVIEPNAQVDSVTVIGEQLVITGTAVGPASELRVVGPRGTTVADLEVAGSGFTARIGADLVAGDHRVELYVDGEPVQVLVGSTPLAEVPAGPVVVQPYEKNGAFGLTARSPLPLAERGRLAQRRLIEEIWSKPSRLDDAIVATSFSGRGGGDNVAPVVRELQRRLADHPVVWGVSDLSVEVPNGARKVLIHSREWHEAVHHSRLLVNNAHFPAYFRKADGQTYLQTWHGTPLKRIGVDVPAEALSLSYRALMRREAEAWDLLLAQSPVAAELLGPAFEYAGQILDDGYPRNDVLLAPDRDARRATLRTELGLRADQLVVLYAPTWRDDEKAAAGGAALVSHLDAHEVHERFGDDAVVLLRGHSNTARSRGVASPYVVDVTEHRDIAELYLVADVLVTDYSSVMFDFAVTGKPMAFLVPDLSTYRDSTRGFYFDLEDIAPGPLVASTDELLDALADVPGLVERHAEAYAAFVARFASLDDGAATARVVDALLDLLHG